MNKKRKGLSAWQLMMLALGTIVGGSFFLGSSVAIRAAGPSIVITYVVGGVMVYYILTALSEMTVAQPDPGSFRTYAAQIFGPGTGFVVGWVYWTGMALGMSSEATAASILLSQWIPNVPVAWMSGAIIVVVTLLNLLGADKLSRLESGLAAVKLFAVISFIIAAFLIITGIFIKAAPLGTASLSVEPFMPGGVGGIAGSLLIIIFAYAGFEIIGLASSEADNPKKTVPRAIRLTVISLVGLYILSVAAILLLIPTTELQENISPMVAALNKRGIGWAGTALNVVLVTAILSTMLATMFGLGRMIRSLADKGHAPKWLQDKRNVPRRGILFSGIGMLAALGFGLLFPSAYLFLISSGGFAALFTYGVIILTHMRFRKKYGCPPDGKCQMPGYPYASWAMLLLMVVAVVSMPFISGQTPGLIAGILIVVLYTCIYLVVKGLKRTAKGEAVRFIKRGGYSASTEFSKELAGETGGQAQEKGGEETEN